ncbi:hypothetical protein GYA28_03350 [Candidatus Roizmanbacteria bacterium]|jgi:hypothetical protein|nr:hypothetical protein [Candidatus Roizmanbacteria bacterium]
MDKKITKIAAIIIGTIVAVVILVMGYRLMAGVLTRAADIEPRDVIISDISQNSVKVTWSSGIDTQGVIEYGNSPTALNFFAPEVQRSKSHSVDLTLLSPNTTYYFQIRIGEKKYDNGGVPWTFTTKGVEKKTVVPTALPTKTPADTTNLPKPIQTIAISPIVGDRNVIYECNETDCQKIKLKLGKGCSTQDYMKCLKKITTTVTTTLTPTP